MFNGGGPLYADFVAVELVNGHVTLRVNKGADDVVMTSRAPVDDGQWHQVRAVSMKLFIQINDIDIAIFCQSYFWFELPCALLEKRVRELHLI